MPPFWEAEFFIPQESVALMVSGRKDLRAISYQQPAQLLLLPEALPVLNVNNSPKSFTQNTVAFCCEHGTQSSVCLGT